MIGENPIYASTLGSKSFFGEWIEAPMNKPHQDPSKRRVALGEVD
jgi:hypothetical protein